jgi:phosphoribosyl 1,2-cyclic phosphodiesterase
VKVKVWGARGSLPDAGPELVRYGGNTSCVEVLGSDGTRLVLDAGTGTRRLGVSIADTCKRVDVLLTHFHMDHVQGLGFFAPMFNSEAEVRIWGPPSTTLSLHQRLTRYLSPPLFPVRLRDFDCKLSLEDAPRGAVTIGGLTVEADLVCHPNPTMGYRITEGNSTVAYLSDHEVALGCPDFPYAAEWTSGYELARGADLLIHDTQYDDAEYAEHVGWGHSSLSQSVAFAELVGARRLMTFHHDPSHDDAALDGLVEEGRRLAEGRLEVIGGTEGTTFDVG